MIVDDEVEFTRPVKEYLERSGQFEVREEHHAQKAFFTAQEFRPDLVLLDIMMMEMDGSEVADQFRGDALLANVPIIFLTGVITRDEANERGGRIGGHPFLAKPIGLKELQATIERYLPRNPAGS